MDILFIASDINPFSPNQGAEQRSNLLLKACVAKGRVDVICFCNNSIQDSYGANILFSQSLDNNILAFPSIGDRILTLISSIFPSKIAHIDKQKERVIDYYVSQKKYDLIVSRYALSSVNCGLFKYADKLIVDIDDNPKEGLLIHSRNSNNIYGKLFYLIYSFNVNIAMNRFRKIVHRTLYSNINDIKKPSLYLPNIPYYQDYELIPYNKAIKGRIVFVGDMTYFPNIEAAEYFIKKVLPILVQIDNSISFHIVGKCNNFIKEKWKDNKFVQVLGYVPSIEKEYEESSVIVIPILSGAGTCIKFLEAAQLGRPIITSRIGYRGYQDLFIPDEDCLVANNTDDFAKKVNMLLNNTQLSEIIALSAHKKYLKNYSKHRINEILDQAIS